MSRRRRKLTSGWLGDAPPDPGIVVPEAPDEDETPAAVPTEPTPEETPTVHPDESADEVPHVAPEVPVDPE